jgi:ferredoxin
LFEARRENGVFHIVSEPHEPRRYAFFGVRACDLAALEIRDRVLLEDRFPDLDYQARRQNAFIVAVDCAEAAATCFCESMGGAPGARSGFDLALTEFVSPHEHAFAVRAGSDAGARMLARIESSEWSERTAPAPSPVFRRHVDREGLRDALYAAFDSPRWEQTAQRCLSCGNCTMSCPTCFCVTFEESSDVTGARAQRLRKWDSCFTHSFSYIHGGSVRLSAKSRYRQWLTHKLAAWVDQFGTEGCVGCGRCITWCPVGIDITEEICQLRKESAR